MSTVLDVGVIFAGGLLLLAVLSFVLDDPKIITRVLQGKNRPPDISEKSTHERAERLVTATREAMKHAPISSGQQNILKTQTKEVLNNIAQGLWKLQRLRKIKELMRDTKEWDGLSSSTESSELVRMEQQLIDQMEHSIQLLSPIPVSLMKVEFAQDNRVDQIITELTVFNQRMGELPGAESRDSVTQLSSGRW